MGNRELIKKFYNELSTEVKEMVESYDRNSDSKRVRKYYSLTKKGKKLLQEKKTEWSKYTSAVNNVSRIRVELIRFAIQVGHYRQSPGGQDRGYRPRIRIGRSDDLVPGTDSKRFDASVQCLGPRARSDAEPGLYQAGELLLKCGE